MHKIRLDPVARSILLALMFNGDDFATDTLKGQMDTADCRDEDTYYRSRKLLVERGYVTLERGPRNTRRMRLTTPPNINPTSLLYINNKDIYINIGNSGLTGYANVVSDEVCGLSNGRAYQIPEKVTPIEPPPIESGTPIEPGVIEPGYLIESGSHKVPVTPIEPGYPIEPGVIESGYSERAVQIDDMDNSGDIALVRSPAGIRRKEQVGVIIEAYTDITHDENELTPTMAKNYLRLCNESAVDVIAGMRDVVARHPHILKPREDGTSGIRTYILKVFMGDKAKASDHVSKEQAPVDRSNEFAGKVQPGELREPDEAYLKRLMEARKRKAVPSKIFLIEGDYGYDGNTNSTGISNAHEGRGRGTSADADESVRSAMGFH